MRGRGIAEYALAAGVLGVVTVASVIVLQHRGPDPVPCASSPGSTACALYSVGSEMGFGALGDAGASGGRRTLPGTVGGGSPLSSVRDVAATDFGGEALRQDGTVWSWGSGFYGERGDGGFADSAVPVQALDPSGNGVLTGVRQVAAGGTDEYALRADGTVLAWGDNTFGGLGSGSMSVLRSAQPAPVLSAGGGGPLGDVVAIAAGWRSCYALLSDGELVAWGLNDHGELGDGSTTQRDLPVRVLGAGGAPLSGVTAVAAGQETAYALLRDGTVVAWGDGHLGALGDGSTQDATHPTQVVAQSFSSEPLRGVVAVSGGAGYAVALLGDHSVMAWGGGTSTAPQAVPDTSGSGTLLHIVSVRAGWADAVAIGADGTAYIWGDNSSGELGTGDSCSPYPCGTQVPQRMHGIAGAAFAAGGGSPSYGFFTLVGAN